MCLVSQMGSLTSLKELWLDDNRLEEFPECLLELNQLRLLRLSGNRIDSIPRSIGQRLSELRELVRNARPCTRAIVADELG